MSRIFQPLRGHRFHTLTDEQLRYVIKDAREAAECMRGFDLTAENKYMDQLCDASTVLAYRKRVEEQKAGRMARCA